MRVSVMGSDSVTVDFAKILPDGLTELVCTDHGKFGKALKEYADEENIPCLLIRASMLANKSLKEIIMDILEITDFMVLVWDGKSEIIQRFIECCETTGKPYSLKIIVNNLKTA